MTKVSSKELEAVDVEGDTPLMYAVYAGNVSAVRSLIFAGADVNRSNLFFDTPLTVAKSFGMNEIIECMLVNETQHVIPRPIQHHIDME